MLTAYLARDSVDTKSWMVDDSIAVRYFVGEQELPGHWPVQPEKLIFPSPDGKLIYFMIRFGVLSRDCTMHELRVFRVEDIIKAMGQTNKYPSIVPTPFRSVSRCSKRTAAAYQAITNVRWSEDSKSIWFLAVEGSEPRHLERLDINSGVVTSVSRDGDDVHDYSVTGRAAIYGTKSFFLPNSDHLRDSYPAVDLANVDVPLAAIITHSPYALFTVTAGNKPRPSVTLNDYFNTLGPWISPDGRCAVVAGASAELPLDNAWADEIQRGDYEERSPTARREGLSTRQFIVIDLVSGSAKSVLGAPLGDAVSRPVDKGSIDRTTSTLVSPRALWSPRSDHVILINTALPYAASAQGPARRHGYIVDYTIRDGSWRVLESVIEREQTDPTKNGIQSHVSDVQWLRAGTELLVAHVGGSGELLGGRVYSLRESKWVTQEVSAAFVRRVAKNRPSGAPSPLELSGRESANEPPIAFAKKGSMLIPLTGPDPALLAPRRAMMQEVSWVQPDGRALRGGLFLPAVGQGNAPPLVIQIGYWSPSLFRPDGFSPTAFAAQSLVARGIAVLLLDPLDGAVPKVIGTPQEGPDFVSSLDFAVQTLADRGYIDPSRVGVVGFSRFGWETYYAITHPAKTRFLAAEVADSTTMGFNEYTWFIALGDPEMKDLVEGFERLYAGSFWSDRAKWLENVPGFNVDRVRTPALFTYAGGDIYPSILETISNT